MFNSSIIGSRERKKTYLCPVVLMVLSVSEQYTGLMLDFATWIHIRPLQASIFSLGMGYNEFMQVNLVALRSIIKL